MKKIVIKISVVVLICFCGTESLLAQQAPQFSFYMFNPLGLNPAYAGSKDVLSATVSNRTQWSSFDGAPITQMLSIHSPLKVRNVGLGLSVINDKIGSAKTTWINGDFSYSLKLDDKKNKLAFGLKAGVDIYSEDFSGRNVHDESDEVYFTSVQGKVLPNFGLGLYYSGDKHYLGLTAPKLLINVSVSGSKTELPPASASVYI